MACIKTAYESHRQYTLIKLIFDDVIKPLDPRGTGIGREAKISK